MAKRLTRLPVVATVAVAVAVAGASAVLSGGAAVRAAVTRPTVMTFDVGWAPSPRLPWADLTQVDLFSLATEKGARLDTSNLAGVDVGRWVAAAHAHHVQALISIGGSDDQHWQYACDRANRKAFVAHLVHYAVSRGFDGIDIDIEDGRWAAQGPPSPAQTKCVRAIAARAHAARSRAGAPLLVSEDVITNWQGAWLAPYAAEIDQFNLMTYGDGLRRLASDVRDTHRQGLPVSKMVVGVDVDDYAEPRGGCRPFARFARRRHLLGAFVWDAVSDRHKAHDACLGALAAGG